MIYIIHNISIPLKITQINLKIIFSNTLLRSTINFFLKKNLFFFTTYNDENIQGLKKTKKIEDNIIKDVRNLFRIKKRNK